jgi:hypothetical protein
MENKVGNSTARAISTVAIAGSFAGIAFASPALAGLAVLGLIASVYWMWGDA